MDTTNERNDLDHLLDEPGEMNDLELLLYNIAHTPRVLPPEVLALPETNGIHFDPHCFRAWTQFASTRDNTRNGGWVRDIDDVDAFKVFLRDFCKREHYRLIVLEIEDQPVPLVDGCWA